MAVDLSEVKVLTQYNAQRHLLEEEITKEISENREGIFNHYDKTKVNVSTVVSSQGKVNFWFDLIWFDAIVILYTTGI